MTLICIIIASVSNVTLQILAGNSVRVSWERVETGLVTHYIVYYSLLEGTGSESQVTVPGSAYSVDIMNINEGSYKFEVVAQTQQSSGKVFQSDRSPPVLLVFHNSTRTERAVSPNASGKGHNSCMLHYQVPLGIPLEQCKK